MISNLPATANIHSTIQPTLVAYVLTDKRINAKALKATSAAVWKCENPEAFTMLDNSTLLCSFNTVKKMEDILKDSPWSVKKSLIIILKKWSPDLTIDELIFPRLPVFNPGA